ncbi:MAG: NAD(P)H-dependent oxidoreductase [Candidatus Woesearchaeota archaeon]
MKTLIIFSHPNTCGHNLFILKTIKDYIDSEIEILNLYEMDYDPILKDKEHYTCNNNYVSKVTERIQGKIKKANNLIFIYPIWWKSMPAILKGFFDRTILSGFAFKYIDGKPVGLLDDKKAFVFMTTGGDKSYYLNEYQYPIKHIKDDILGFCGINTKVEVFGRCFDLDLKKKEEIKNRIKNVLKSNHLLKE